MNLAGRLVLKFHGSSFNSFSFDEFELARSSPVIRFKVDLNRDAISMAPIPQCFESQIKRRRLVADSSPIK